MRSMDVRVELTVSHLDQGRCGTRPATHCLVEPIDEHDDTPSLDTVPWLRDTNCRGVPSLAQDPHAPHRAYIVATAAEHALDGTEG